LSRRDKPVRVERTDRPLQTVVAPRYAARLVAARRVPPYEDCRTLQ